MLTKNEIVNLRKRVVQEFNKVKNLEEKLKMYNEDLCKREDLQRRVNDLQRVLEDVALDMKHTHENHLKKKDSISKMLENCKMSENSLNANNQKLRDAIEHISRRIDDQKLNKENLISNIEKLNKCNDNLENELGTVKAGTEERDEANARLSRRLACARDECRDARQRTDECRATVGRLRDKCAALAAGLERGLAAAADARARLTEATGRLELERGALAGRLEAAERVLRDTRAECADVRRRAADEERDAAALAARETELRDVDAALRRDADERARRLGEDVVATTAHVRRLDEQLAALRRDGAVATEVASLARLVRDKEERLAGARRRADHERRERADECQRWDRRVAALGRDVRELEREAGRLRGRVEDGLPCGRLESGDDAGGRDHVDDDGSDGRDRSEPTGRDIALEVTVDRGPADAI